jgi:hypothetical protein
MKKHTEWITALEFSPDGVLLATGDRNNGLVIWEAQTGREFFDLRGHTAAITDVSWRLDSNVVASSAEDGSVRLWEMENGNQIKSWGAHPGGVASARFAKDGRVVTTGRDRFARIWDQNGGKQKEFEPFGDLALRAVFADDDTKVVAGDWSGEVRVIDGKEGKKVANLLANPAPIATRLEQALALAQAARVLADNASKELAPLQAAVNDKASLTSKAQQAHAQAREDARHKLEAVASAEKLDAEKAKLQAAVAEAFKAAQVAAEKANAEKLAAEKAIGETTLAEKAASEAIAGARATLEKSFNEKVAHDQAFASAVEALKSSTTKAAADQAGASLSQAVARSVELTAAVANAGKNQVEALIAWDRALAAKAAAPGLLAASTEKARAAVEAIKPAQAALDRANAARAEVAKALADSRNAQQAANGVADARKRDLDASNAAKVAAEKALANKRPAVEALVAKADDLKAEVESLSAELKTLEASRTATNPGTPPGSGTEQDGIRSSNPTRPTP